MKEFQSQHLNKAVQSNNKIALEDEGFFSIKAIQNHPVDSLEINNLSTEWDNLLNYKMSNFVDWDMRKE